MFPRRVHSSLVQKASGAHTTRNASIPRPTPDTRPPSDGYPVVLFFYGGSWTSGERRDYKFIGEALASHGIVAIQALSYDDSQVSW